MTRRKGKIQSINFEEDTYALLTDEVYKTSNNYSGTINKLILSTIGLDADVKEEIAMHAYEVALKLKKNAGEESGFGKAALLRKSDQYMGLVSLLTSGKGFSMPIFENMQRIDMKNSYLVCPDDWVKLELCDPSQSEEAIVIEFHNGEKFHLPHFVFVVDKPLDLSMEQRALEQAAQVSKEYKKAKAMYQDPRYASDGRMLNAKEFKEQPIAGFFKLPTLGTANEYPFGAMVIKTGDDNDV